MRASDIVRHIKNKSILLGFIGFILLTALGTFLFAYLRFGLNNYVQSVSAKKWIQYTNAGGILSVDVNFHKDIPKYWNITTFPGTVNVTLVVGSVYSSSLLNFT